MFYYLDKYLIYAVEVNSNSKSDVNTNNTNADLFEMIWNNPLVGENEVKIRIINDSNRYKLEGHIHKGNLFRVLFFVGEKIQMVFYLDNTEFYFYSKYLINN